MGRLWQRFQECFDQVVLLATGGFLVYSGAIADSVTYFTEAGGAGKDHLGGCGQRSLCSMTQESERLCKVG